MPGRVTLVGAGELMSSMSSLHRAALARLKGPPRPVFLDTTAGYETNIDAIAEKACEYYQHHLQVELRIAKYRHRERATEAEIAAAVAEIRQANLIFAGPGSPSYAIKHWRDTPIWDSVLQQFEAGADLLFASAASITLSRYALPVYEIYKAGEDPYWMEGLNVLGLLGLNLAVVPHFNDNSGGENYDSRFCYMGARRFDMLQEQLPDDVSILGIDAYTAICFDPYTGKATVSGQGSVTLIANGAEQRFGNGAEIPFEAFTSSHRGVVRTADEGASFGGYEFTDTEAVKDVPPFTAVREYVEQLRSLKQDERIELLARIEAAERESAQATKTDDAPLVELVLELREALRSMKRYDLADKARAILDSLGYEVGDTAQGARWTKR